MSADSMKWQQRSEQLLAELHYAAQRAPNDELLMLLAAHPLNDFARSIVRRGRNMIDLLSRLSSGVLGHAEDAWEANSQGRLRNYFEHAGHQIKCALEKTAENVTTYITNFASSPRQEALRVGALALTAIIASGGVDGDGGLPDTDIAILGIEAHRSPLTHSILAGAVCETLINTFIRLIILLHRHLPAQHDPVWDEFAQHSQELLDAVSRGVSVGLAYHLLIDGLVQPAPYHGLPFPMPMEVHQALQTANGLLEAADAATRLPLKERSPELIWEHRAQLDKQILVVEELEPWLPQSDYVILRKQGGWLYALSTGEIAPYTDKQVKFVAVAWQLHPATTAEELAWIRLINLLRIATWKPTRTLDSTFGTVKTWFERLKLLK